MRIGIQASYSGGFRETAAEIRELESAGLDLADERAVQRVPGQVDGVLVVTEVMGAVRPL